MSVHIVTKDHILHSAASLVFDGCKFLNVNNLRIKAPVLGEFKFVECSYFYPFNPLGEYIVEISGGRSTESTYIGDFQEKFVILNPSRIETLKLHLNPTCLNCLQVFSEARNLLAKVSVSLTVFELYEDCFKPLKALAHCEPLHPLPVFEELKHVKVPLLCFMDNCMRDTSLELLMKAPQLETLIISPLNCKKRARGVTFMVENSDGPSAALFTRLKTVKFESFHRRFVEIELVKFLLKHATVLEEIGIPLLTWDMWKVVEKQILCFQKASPNVSLVFY